MPKSFGQLLSKKFLTRHLGPRALQIRHEKSEARERTLGPHGWSFDDANFVAVKVALLQK